MLVAVLAQVVVAPSEFVVAVLVAMAVMTMEMEMDMVVVNLVVVAMAVAVAVEMEVVVMDLVLVSEMIDYHQVHIDKNDILLAKVARPWEYTR